MEKNLEQEVIELINFIKKEMREMNLDATDVFLNGNCGNLYQILAKEFGPIAKPYLIKYDGKQSHMLIKIQDIFYDITGKTTLEEYIEYVKTHNRGVSFNNSDFKIEELQLDSIYINKMRNMYDYDEDYEESRISSQMGKLLSKISERNKIQDDDQTR